MKKQSLLSILSLVSIFTVSLWLTACEEETTEPPGPTDIAGPSYIGAYSENETTVGIVWTASVDEANAEVLNPAYRINVKDAAGNVLQSLTAVKGATDPQMSITGLTEGTVYSFTISMIVASTAVTDDSVTVMWSPAKRMAMEGSLPIRVYETTSTTFFSGLDIYSATIDGPQTLSLTGGSNSLIDLFVFTDPLSQDLIIRSAHLSTVIPTPKTTFFSTEIDESDDLQFDNAIPPDASTYSTSAVTISGTDVATTGRIIYGRTQENNYFRLLIVRNSTSLLFGLSPDRYLTVVISYQSVAGVPYARPVNREHDWLRNN